MSQTFTVTDPETVQSRYDAACSHLSHLNAEINILNRLSKVLDGAYCTKSIESRVRQAFPGYAVSYSQPSYTKWCYLHFAAWDEAKQSIIFRATFPLRSGDEPRRLTAAQIIAHGKHIISERDRLSAALEKYYTVVQQINTLIPAVNAYYRLTDEIYPVTSIR